MGNWERMITIQIVWYSIVTLSHCRQVRMFYGLYREMNLSFCPSYWDILILNLKTRHLSDLEAAAYNAAMYKLKEESSNIWTGQGFHYRELVRPAGLSSRPVKLICLVDPSGWFVLLALCIFHYAHHYRQDAHVAKCSCYKVHRLQSAQVERCMCCKVHMFQSSHVVMCTYCYVQ